MRTEQQVRAAMRHLREGLGAAPPDAVPHFYLVANGMLLDVLAWVLGEPSNFSDLVSNCDTVDRAGRQ